MSFQIDAFSKSRIVFKVDSFHCCMYIWTSTNLRFSYVQQHLVAFVVISTFRYLALCCSIQFDLRGILKSENFEFRILNFEFLIFHAMPAWNRVLLVNHAIPS